MFTFSGFTKGLYPVKKLNNTDDGVLFQVELPKFFSERLAKKRQKIQNPHLEIDGVPAEIIMQENSDDIVRLHVKVPIDLYKKTTLKKFDEKVVDQASIGLESMNENKFLIESQPLAIAKLISFDKPDAEGKQMLIFKTSLDFAEKYLRDGQWIGINGSSLAVYDINIQASDNTALFTVYIKFQRTRDLTVFGVKDQMYIGQEFNLTPRYEKSMANIADCNADLGYDSKKFKFIQK